LEKGLSKFKDEPQVTKYVKIAATLPDKSVRDVAMRCKWMTVSSQCIVIKFHKWLADFLLVVIQRDLGNVI
jgi:hypothetical protein